MIFAKIIFVDFSKIGCYWNVLYFTSTVLAWK